MPKPGDPLPPFSLTDHTGKTVRNSDLIGQRTVIWFYPKADTPG
jgi:peroxiredoxin Q/BCP